MTGSCLDLNGAKIYYEEQGSGTPIVLVHGGFDIERTVGTDRAIARGRLPDDHARQPRPRQLRQPQR